MSNEWRIAIAKIYTCIGWGLLLMAFEIPDVFPNVKPVLIVGGSAVGIFGTIRLLRESSTK